MAASTAMSDTVVQQPKPIDQAAIDVLSYSYDKKTIPALAQTNSLLEERIPRPFFTRKSIPVTKNSTIFRKIRPNGFIKFNSELEFAIPKGYHFLGKLQFYAKFEALGISGSSFTQTATRYKWADYPGFRILRTVDFRIDDKPVLTITSRDIFADFDGLQNGMVKTVIGNLAGQTQLTESRLYHDYYQTEDVLGVYDGYQTSKTYQPELEVKVDLPFWFCKTADESFILNDVNNFKLVVTFEEVNKMVKRILQQDVEAPVTTEPKILECYIVAEMINVPNDIYNELISHTLIYPVRLTDHITKLLTSPRDVLKFSDKVKEAIESFDVGFLPEAHESSLALWHVYTVPIEHQHEVSWCNPIDATIAGLMRSVSVYYTYTPTVNTINIDDGMNNSIFDGDIPITFFRTLPDDSIYYDQKNGLLRVKANTHGFKGRDFTSGYINTRSLLEYKLKWNSSYISQTNHVTMYITLNTISYMVVKITDDLEKYKFISS